MNRWLCYGAAIAAIATAALVTAGAVKPAPIEPGRIEVVDGDTIAVGRATFRLVGYDTPETGSRARCEAERAKGAAAVRRLRQLIAAGGLDLRPVRCACTRGTEGTRRCNFGRLCAAQTIRGRDAGAILIDEGLARSYACSGTRCPPRGDWCGGRP